MTAPASSSPPPHADRRPQRIAFCITGLNVGGAERVLTRLVTALDRREWEPLVLCLGPEGPFADRIRAASVPVEILGARGSVDAPRVLWTLVRRLRAFRPAVLQSFLFHANVIGALAGRLAGVPRVATGIRVAEREKLWHLRWQRRITRLVDVHVCVSGSVAEHAATVGGLPRERLVVIHNGVSLEEIDAVPAADMSAVLSLAEAGPPPRTVLCVGRLDEQKDPLGLLAVASAFLSAGGDVHLVYVGDGPLRSRLEQRIAEHPLRERIHCLGRRDDVLGLMKAATCLVLPSRWEGMPNVVLEAMAAGLPVVAFDVEGVRELIPDDRFGAVVPSGDSAALAAAVRTLLEDADRRRGLARAARQRIAEDFTLRRMVEKYASLYRSLIDGRFFEWQAHHSGA
ncbi:MAG: glycosyltransferase [Planctomycetota bacterium]|nr:MAG: glycosyltransferase [Planctomycetota bacterium]